MSPFVVFVLFMAVVSVLIVVAALVIDAFEFSGRDNAAVEPTDVEYESACAWRSINLALTHPDHEEANEDLAALKKAGWHIEKSGHHRAGFVYLKLIAPDHKE
jgi:hypothetical protein